MEARSFYSLLFLLLGLASVNSVHGQGTRQGFYSSSCPRAESIVKSTVQSHVKSDSTLAAGLLRMHFHDCFVQGCDGSVLISGANTEKTAFANLGLRGFEVVDDAKTQLEAACPGVVSCADILALAARDSVVLSGGLSYQVPTGRRDGRISQASDVSNLPAPFDSVDVQKQKFTAKGLNTQDLVTLLGAHTIGTTACQFFSNRLYNFTANGPDPSIDPSFLPTLQSLCPQNGDGSTRVALDTGSQKLFDLSYYNNLRKGRGILQSDQALWSDDSTQKVVQRYLGLIRGLLGLKFNVEFGLKLLNKKLRRLSSHLKWPLRRRSKSKPRFGKTTPKPHTEPSTCTPEPPPPPSKPIRIATFNAAFFSMAPVLPQPDKSATSDDDNVERPKSTYDRPRGILKQSQSPLLGKSKLRVSINLPDNEISLRQTSFSEHERAKGSFSWSWSFAEGVEGERQRKTVLEVLREVNADVLGLQDVKAEEENGMKPLSDLARALGMNYVFAESWAPQYGNAVLSKWPIKRWKLQKIFDHTDFRNVLKATIDVPEEGELQFYCTNLDHLDEKWRMKQINAIIESNDEPHILAGGLNSLDESDYSQERWTDIVKYYEEMGKPTPKVEVMKYLKNRQYRDAKEFSGEYESVVMIAKGQSVQGTCKYGTRVDYILSSSDSPYKFVSGSYLVLSSKGTSDHHIVKADVVKINSNPQENLTKKQGQPGNKVVRIKSTPSKCIWKTQTADMD